MLVRGVINMSMSHGTTRRLDAAAACRLASSTESPLVSSLSSSSAALRFVLSLAALTPVLRCRDIAAEAVTFFSACGSFAFASCARVSSAYKADRAMSVSTSMLSA